VVTREQVERTLFELKGRPGPFQGRASLENQPDDFWDVFLAVDDPSFSPLVAGTASNAVWWTSEDDRAFDASGALRSPLAFSWRGDWTQLQVAFARAGLTPRLDRPPRDEYDERDRLGLLSPRSEAQTTDLSRLFAAFAALRGQGAIALERAGNTQSEGWEDVAQIGEAETAVFWHAQSHEAFDGLGQLERRMFLYWRGDRGAIVGALKKQGLSATLPASDDVGIEVGGARASAPDLEPFSQPCLPAALLSAPEVAGEHLLVVLARSSASAGPQFHQPGHPVEVLRFSPDGGQVFCGVGFGSRGFPEVPSALLEAKDFRRAEVLQQPGSSATCGGAQWLPDGRLLLAWRAYALGKSLLRLTERLQPGALHDLLSLEFDHLGEHNLMACDGAGSRVALPTARGVALRQIGAPGAEVRPQPRGVTVRRAKPSPPGPWEEAGRMVDDSASEAYAMVALSPDGLFAARTASGDVTALCFEVETRLVRWRGGLYDQTPGARGVAHIAFTPWGQLAVLPRSSRGDRDERTLVLFDARDGSRRWRACERTVAQPTAIACHPTREVLVLGSEDGHVTLVTLRGERVGGRPVFRWGSVSALDVNAEGRIVVGSSRGELAVLFWQ
jgi:hypothetical protein